MVFTDYLLFTWYLNKHLMMMSEVDVGRICDLNYMCSQYTAMRVKTYDIPYLHDQDIHLQTD